MCDKQIPYVIFEMTLASHENNNMQMFYWYF